MNIRVSDPTDKSTWQCLSFLGYEYYHALVFEYIIKCEAHLERQHRVQRTLER